MNVKQLHCRGCGEFLGQVEVIALPRDVAHLCARCERKRCETQKAVLNKFKGLGPAALKLLAS